MPPIRSPPALASAPPCTPTGAFCAYLSLGAGQGSFSPQSPREYSMLLLAWASLLVCSASWVCPAASSKAALGEGHLWQQNPDPLTFPRICVRESTETQVEEGTTEAGARSQPLLIQDCSPGGGLLFPFQLSVKVFCCSRSAQFPETGSLQAGTGLLHPVLALGTWWWHSVMHLLLN